MNHSENITVGFIGLGSQGAPMARRIAVAGFPTILWSRRPESVAPYADTDARIAPDLAALGAACDHVGICVVDDTGVVQICESLLPAMRSGSSVAIHSTVLPQTCVALADMFRARGISLIDAPVSGGGPGALAGTLTVMVGGDAATFAAVRPVFETFAGLILHLGGVGAGQTAKLINNTLMAANMALADAMLNSAEALGLDGAALTKLVQASSGRSYAFEVRARLTDIAMFAHGARLLAKDVGLLGELIGANPEFMPVRDIAQFFLERITRVRVQN